MNKLKQLPTALLILIIGLTSCEKEGKQLLPERNYQLVWSEEFNDAENTPLDSTKWTFDIGRGDNGWGNQELQHYTDRPDNVKIDGNGHLVITAIQESFNGANYTSGRIKTEGLFSQQYGKIEASIKLPYGPGLWPAFWLLGDDINTVGWPQCGEIDIMEFRGQEPTIIHGSMHGPGYSAAEAVTEFYNLGDQRFDADFHTYAVEWGQGYVDFFVDGFRYNRITTEDVPEEWVFDDSFFIILNVAVGGSYVGFPNVNTPFPQKMYVDYVRVYQE